MPKQRTPPPTADRGSSRSTFLILAVILLVGAALRIAYLREIVSAPDFAAPITDAAFHDYWARGLLTGDWTPPARQPDPRIGEVPYLRPPGYPYFLAGLYALTGKSYLGARILQMALGLGNAVLAFLLARTVFSPAVGLVLAGLCATYWSFLFFEGELHAPVLVTTLNLATLLGLLAWARRPAARRGFLAGVWVGLGALVQTNALLFAPVGALWIAIGGRRLAKRDVAMRSALAYLAGTIVAVAPATLRNAVVAKDFVPVASNGAITLLLGNHEGADGVSSRLPAIPEFGSRASWSWFTYDEIVRALPSAKGRPLRYSEASRLFTDRAVEFIRRRPREFLALTGRRALLFWGPDEVSNDKAIRVEKERSATLRHLFGFPWVVSISLLGAGALVLGSRRRIPLPEDRAEATGAGAPATAGRTGLAKVPHFVLAAGGLYILVTFVSFLPFLAAARFRAPLVPLVFLFGSFGLVRLADTLRRRAWWHAAAALAIWAVVFLGCRHSFHGSAEAEAWWHTDRASAFLRSGRTADAVSELRQALLASPGYVDARVSLADLLGTAGGGDEAIMHYREVLKYRPNRADVRLKLGALLVKVRRFEEAITELETVVRASPISAEAHFEMGRALIEEGRIDEGIEELRLSLQFDSHQAAAHVNVGAALASRGDHEGALAEYAKALELDASDADAELKRGESLQALGRVDDAVAALAHAFELRPQSASIAIQAGNLLMGKGGNEKAAEWFRRAVALEPRNAMARTSLAGALSNAGKYDEAVKELEATVAMDPTYGPAQERLRVLRAWLQSSGKGTAARGG